MNQVQNIISEITLEELMKKYNIISDEECKTLKEGKQFIDSALAIKDDKSKVRIGSALIEYMLYKMNGGK